MRRYLTLFVFSLLPLCIAAQKCPQINYKDPWYHPVKDRVCWWEAYAGGYDGWHTVNFGGYIFSVITLDLGVGSSGINLGLMGHMPVRSKHLDPYAGIQFGLNSGLNIASWDVAPANGTLFFPVGCRYIFSDGITIGIEAEPHTGNTFPALWGAIKLGYCFRTY